MIPQRDNSFQRTQPNIWTSFSHHQVREVPNARYRLDRFCCIMQDEIVSLRWKLFYTVTVNSCGFLPDMALHDGSDSVFLCIDLLIWFGQRGTSKSVRLDWKSLLMRIWPTGGMPSVAVVGVYCVLSIPNNNQKTMWTWNVLDYWILPNHLIWGLNMDALLKGKLSWWYSIDVRNSYKENALRCIFNEN